MIIACPACFTRYVVPDTAIGVEGRTVRCAKCRHSWFQEGPQVTRPAPSPAPPPPPTPPPVAPPPPPAPPVPPPPPPEAPEAEPPADRVPAPSPPEAGEAPVPSPEPAPSPAAEPEAPEPATPRVEPPAPPQSPEPEPEAAPVVAPASPPIAYGDDEEVTYEDAGGYSDDYGEEDLGASSFDHTPPFRPRRNIPKLLMIAAIVFAVIALAAAAWVWRYGLPEWVPASHSTFAEAQPDLVLDFPPNRQDRRTLPNGTEFFGASGMVTNVGSVERSVPSILIVMRDSRERIVYSWEVIPPKRRLAPGESVNINEAVTDVPKSAVAAEIGWKPG